MIDRGSIHWAHLGPLRGNRPAKRRPVLVVQSQVYNASRIATVVVAAITSNTTRAALPSSVFIPSVASGLRNDSVVNLTALTTLDKSDLAEPVGRIDLATMEDVDRALRRVLGL